MSATSSLWPMLPLTFALGMRHGLDADHLATIDGLTRFNAAAGRPRLARFCGALFSLGHGGVVCVVAALAAAAYGSTHVPEWFDAVGGWISAGFLLLLGTLNLHTVLCTPAGQPVRLVGVKGRWLGRLAGAGSPGLVVLVGVLFALSFDTLSQAVLFSAASAQGGGWALALGSALVFMLGMLTTDAVNGLWLCRLLRSADARALAASRVMGLTVALLSLAVAGLGVAHLLLPAVAAWQDGRELVLGTAVVATVLLAFAWSARLRPVPAR